MPHTLNFKNFSFLIYGLGASGKSTLNFLKKKKTKNLFIWDDNKYIRKKFKIENKRLKNEFKNAHYIVLSPGVSIKNAKFSKELQKYRKKVITDLDLLYLSNKKFKSIVITGTNGKSTTSKIIAHLLKKNNFKVKLGGNIGTPVLKLNVRQDTFLIIEASSFQLSYSKFIHPNYALLLNITNDHLDWHGSKQNYINSKFRIFNLQNKNDYALINNNLTKIYKKKRYLGKRIDLKIKNYLKIKSKINNDYLNLKINDENMSFVLSISKILKIKQKLFIKSLKSFKGLPHRYEIFLKRKNITFINDSKATTLEAAKFALNNSKNIYWIVGGLPKYKDKISLIDNKKDIIRCYIIGKNLNFFKKQFKNKIKFSITRTLRGSILKIFKDINSSKEKQVTILLSPGAASFDQFENFENRGNIFKKLCRSYAKKFI